MPIFALIFPAARIALGGLWSLASSPIGRLLIVAGVAWAWSGQHERAACEARAAALRAELQRAAEAEHVRRETVIAEAQAVGAAEAEALARTNLDLEIRLKESEDASRANDSRACLDRSGVLRLQRLAR